MEGLSVNLDALLVMREDQPIGAMGLRCFRFPEVPEGTYRFFFTDGSQQDVQAENASMAYQAVGRTGVERIVSLKHAYSHILERGVIHPSGEEVAAPLEPQDSAQRFATVAERPHGNFELLDLADFAQLTQSKHAS
jgi:hypothetical protein